MKPSRLFAASCIALIVTAMGFAQAARASDAAPFQPADILHEYRCMDAELSPDGQCLGFVSALGDKDGYHWLYFMELDTGKLTKVEVPDEGHSVEIKSLLWVNSHRAIMYWGKHDGDTRFAEGLDRDGTHRRLFGAAGVPSTVIHVFHDGSDRVLMEKDNVDFEGHASVADFDAITGNFGFIADDSAGVMGWVSDQDGNVRFGVTYDFERTAVVYRANNDSPFVRLPDFDCQGLGDFPVAVDFDGRTALVKGLTPYGTWGIYTYDLLARKRGPLVLADKVYDIVMGEDLVGRDEFLFSQKSRRLAGIRYPSDRSRTVWFDPQFQGVQAALDRAIPDRVNTLVSWSDDETRFLIQSWSDRTPGAYYLLDRRKGQLRKLFDIAPWIDPSRMSRMYPFEFRARDGLMVHGLVTIPAGSSGKNLPLVVYPHENVLQRDFVGYDTFIQYLALRGYAVLQVEVRGTPGYGKAFEESGRRQAGIGMQNDITDGVKWAEAAGIADPKRVAIVGFEFGGFSAEWGLAREPGLYRCGVSVNGTSDWVSLVRYYNRNAYSTPIGKQFLRTQFGNLKTDEPMLRDMSPINHVDGFRAPIFLIHDKIDDVNPPAQSKDLANELTARGKPCELWIRDNFSTKYLTVPSFVELYTRIGDFLDKNMK